MIYSELELPANPPGAVPLDRQRIWEGLEQKALDAVPYVEAITACREIARLSDTVFDREIELGGARYVERATLPVQRLLPLAAVTADEAPYFTMILVHRRGSAWR